jgi:hypothetical protein
MVYHTFVSGEVLTAANVMNDLMNQSVISCTSGTRPASPVAGMTVYETDTGNISVYSGTAWNQIGISLGSGGWASYTPSFTNFTLGNGTVAAGSRQTGKSVAFRIYLSIGSTSSASGGVSISLPVAASTVSAQYAVVKCGNGVNLLEGYAEITNASGLQVFLPTSTTNVAMVVWSGSMGGVALAAGQTIGITGTYEAA